MNADLLCPGTYIKATEYEGLGDMTWTIEKIILDLVADLKDSEKSKKKGIIFLRGIDRGWVMNVTNKECLKGMFGKETDKWLGKRITVYTVPVRVGAGKELGFRLRGSPDLPGPIDVVVNLGKKRAPLQLRMEKTNP